LRKVPILLARQKAYSRPAEMLKKTISLLPLAIDCTEKWQIQQNPHIRPENGLEDQITAVRRG